MTYPETLIIVIAIALALAALAFWVSMVIHCYKNSDLNTEERWLWLALIVLGKIVGAGAYYLVRYRKSDSPTLAEAS